MAPSRSIVDAVPAVAGTVPDRLVVAEWLFRIAVAMEFVGHGAFGIMTKAAWVPYFGALGIPEAWAWRLMPIVGTVDVALGVLTLIAPVRAVLLHMAVWGLMTAALRPLSGEGVFELFERGYNYGVPLAFLLFAGVPTTARAWLTRIDRRAGVRACAMAALTLRSAIALCLVGHGGIALFTPTRWASHFRAIGVPDASAPSALAAAGGFEIALGMAIAVAPVTPLLVLAAVWKIGTELLRIPAGEPIWEIVERGGAYAAPVLLVLLSQDRRQRRRVVPARTVTAGRGARPASSTCPC